MTTFVSTFMIIFGIFGLIAMYFKIQKEAKEEILDELFKKGEISADTYKKYLNK